MDIREVFAANLRRFRQAKGISQEDLAYTANVNRSYLSKLEKGSTYVGLEIMAKLATVLEVEPADLLRQPDRARRGALSAAPEPSHPQPGRQRRNANR
jgi:transcriptional regulator with XRE-family HTH domain